MNKKSIIIMIVIFLIIFIGFLIYKNRKYVIPDDYVRKIENYMSYLDGSDEDIYVYNDKIIVEENSYYPYGQHLYTHCRTITSYKGINDPEKIKEKNGKIVFKKFE